MADFDLNPETPPVAKVVAAAALLSMQLAEPAQQGRDSQLEAFLDGKDFLFRNDADQMLLRGRFMISLFTFALALLVFYLAKSMFGATAGVLALAFLVFDPTSIEMSSTSSEQSAGTAHLCTFLPFSSLSPRCPCLHYDELEGIDLPFGAPNP